VITLLAGLCESGLYNWVLFGFHFLLLLVCPSLCITERNEIKVEVVNIENPGKRGSRANHLA